MHRLFYSAYCYLKKRRRLFFITTILVFSGLLYIDSKIDFDEDVSRFIPKNPENETLQMVLESTNFNDNIVVLFQKDSETETDKLTDLAGLFIDKLHKGTKEHIINIQGFVEDGNALEILDFAQQYAPLFLNDKDYVEISKKLSNDSINEITRSNYQSIISPSGIISRDLILKDPLKISILALQNLNPLGIDEDFILKNGFLVSKDERNLLLFITPDSDQDSKKYSKELIKTLRNLKKDLLHNFEETISIEYYGGPIIGDGNARQIKMDILLTVGIALFLLMLLFIYFYKNLAIPLILLVPTLFGGLLGVFALFLVRDQVSAISLGIGSILLGVTLDYALHILTHIRNGRDIHLLYHDISKPLLMSSLTTALAFLCLLFIDSQALQDLGIFASVSVIAASVFALVFIPLAYVPKTNSDHPEEISNTFLDRVAAYNFDQNKVIIVILVVMSIISVFTYSSVRFDNDLSKLNYMHEELKATENRLDSITNVSDKTLYISSYGNDFENVLHTNDGVYSKLEELQKEGLVKSFTSLSRYLKSQKNQTDNLHKWQEFWTPGRIDSTKLNLVIAGNEFSFKEDAFQRFYAYLESDFETVSKEDFENLDDFQLENFYSTKKNFTTITSMLKLDDKDIVDVKTAFSNFENTVIIDRQELNERLLGNLKSNFDHLIWYCLIAVILLIFVFYRNFKLTVVTVAPIVLTWIVTIGIMGILNLEFNIFNIIICSFIFGLGVDYSIFITNGMLNKLNGSPMALVTNKTSILLSVLTTITGIGVMIFAKHPALHSIALISIIGIFSAMIIAFTIQPLLFNLLIKTRNGKN